MTYGIKTNEHDYRATQGRLQLTGRGNLQIHNVNESDSGMYSCRAENMEDSVDADAELKVVGKTMCLGMNSVVGKVTFMMQNSKSLVRQCV